MSNLSAVCLRCLCTASTQCNRTVGCQKDYCGPFLINKEYWREAQRPTLKDDDPDRTNGMVNRNIVLTMLTLIFCKSRLFIL